MSRRTFLIALMTFLLCASSLSAYSAKPPIPGGVCTKLGRVETYQGKKYACIKSGKKIVWSKGVAVTKLPTPTPTPSTASPSPSISISPSPSIEPTPSPTPSQNPSATPFPTPSPTPTATPTPTPSVIRKIFDDLSAFPISNDVPQKVSFNFGPNADKAFSDWVVVAGNSVMKFFVDFYQDPRAYPIFFGDTKDVEWIINEWAKFGYGEEYQKTDLRTRAPNGITVNYWGSPQAHFTMVFSPEQIKKFGDEQGFRSTIITHHVVHGVQSRITGARFEYLACWANEGGAEFYGAMVASRYMGLDYLNYRRMSIGNWTQSKPTVDLRKFNENQWFDMLKILEGDPFCDSSKAGNLQYNTGMLIMERLVGDFGHKKVMEWWYSFRQSTNWRENFKNTFGIDSDSWYRTSAISYLIEQYRDWIPHSYWEGVKS